MTIKKELKKGFSDSEKLQSLRLSWAKILFIFFSFLFFLDYYLVWLNFAPNFTILVFPFLYLTFIVSFIIYFYLLLTLSFNKNYIKYLITFLFLIIFIILMFPILFKDSSLFGVINPLFEKVKTYL